MSHTTTEKKIAKNVLSIVSLALRKAMATIDAHEGRYMQKKLKLEKSLVGKRRYVHTATYWAKKSKKKK